MERTAGGCFFQNGEALGRAGGSQRGHGREMGHEALDELAFSGRRALYLDAARAGQSQPEALPPALAQAWGQKEKRRGQTAQSRVGGKGRSAKQGPHQCFLRRPSSISRASRASKDMPTAWASWGSRLVAVIPGRVLTSRMCGMPFSSTMKSARL